MPTQAAPMRTPRAILLCRMGPFHVASRVRQTVYQAVEQATKKSDLLRRSCSGCVADMPCRSAQSLPWKLREFGKPRSWIRMNEQMWLAREPGKAMSYPTLLALPKKVVRRWRAVWSEAQLFLLVDRLMLLDVICFFGKPACDPCSLHADLSSRLATIFERE